MAFATGRQRYLLRQGYAYKVIKSTDFDGYEAEQRRRPFAYSTPHEQETLLASLIEHKTSVCSCRVSRGLTRTGQAQQGGGRG